jgi:hypothetical protein
MADEETYGLHTPLNGSGMLQLGLFKDFINAIR